MFLPTRFALLAGFFVFLTAVAAHGTEEFANPPRPFSVVMGEQIAANLVDLIFLFDRVASDPPTATTPDYLERVSQPSSPFYNDYLEYRQGRISRAELLRRLPHVAMIGDSLTQHFYISSPISLFWRARTQRRKNWFLDTDLDPASIRSVYERLQTFTPLVATEYNGAGALVAPTRASEGIRRSIVRTRNLSGQAHSILRKQRFPDLILIWIGHNNLDWVEGLSPTERAHPEKRLQEIATQFRQNYTEPLQWLVDRAKTENHRVAIVVFGLANLEAFFKARRKAEALHAKNPALYPYFESGNRSFESLKSPYQNNMVRLGLMLNGEMRAMVSDLDRQLAHNSNVRVQYSDALANVNFSRLELINPADAWHPSIEGQKALAAAAFSALGPSLKFLGIGPKRTILPAFEIVTRRMR
ncbi:MAG TPA: SGNH/GDSL hydrolase family protein [Candidatus Udaeobacter sp.]|jgi:lysophospholipase L1-like esterase